MERPRIGRDSVSRQHTNTLSTYNQNQATTVNFLELPPEVRDNVYRLLLQDCKTYLGRYGPQPNSPGQARLRRLVSPTTPDPTSPLSDFPRHPWEFVHSLITAEFRQRIVLDFDGQLILGKMKTLPLHIFPGIRHLTLSIELVMKRLHAVIPRLRPSHTDPGQPQTPLTLPFAPGLQELSIYWKPEYKWWPWAEIEDERAAIVIARLTYFRRSFRATVHVEAVDDVGMIAMRGDLVDGEDQHKSFWVLSDHADDNVRQSAHFYTRMLDVMWDKDDLQDPDSLRYKAVVDAHPMYPYVPLGYLAGVRSSFDLGAEPRPQRLLTPRPFQT